MSLDLTELSSMPLLLISWAAVADVAPATSATITHAMIVFLTTASSLLDLRRPPGQGTSGPTARNCTTCVAAR